MKIEPLQTVKNIPFGARRDDISCLGIPERKSLNSQNEEEIQFSDIIFRFIDGYFVEASFEIPDQLTIADKVIPKDELLPHLRSYFDYYESAGFGIVPSIGFAYDLDDSGWATVFKLGHWDSIKKK